MSMDVSLLLFWRSIPPSSLNAWHDSFVGVLDGPGCSLLVLREFHGGGTCLSWSRAEQKRRALVALRARKEDPQDLFPVNF